MAHITSGTTQRDHQALSGHYKCLLGQRDRSDQFDFFIDLAFAVGHAPLGTINLEGGRQLDHAFAGHRHFDRHLGLNSLATQRELANNIGFGFAGQLDLVDSKVIVGYLSTSKKSGPFRWSFSLASSDQMLLVSIVSLSEPFSGSS